MARRATTVLRMVLALACLCLAVAATVRCAPQAARLVEYEGVFAGAAGAGGPGAAAIVVKDGRTLFRQARGSFRAHTP